MRFGMCFYPLFQNEFSVPFLEHVPTKFLVIFKIRTNTSVKMYRKAQNIRVSVSFLFQFFCYKRRRMWSINGPPCLTHLNTSAYIKIN